MVSLLALTWVLLTAHCKMEVIPGFEFLRCATEVHAPADSDSGGDPCDGGACCSMESAQFRALRQNEVQPAVVIAIVPRVERGIVEASLPNGGVPGVLTAAPPELPGTWQFLWRTALPVRAPSSAS